ncbi:MAG: hypothetical protein Q9198_010212 [Flavoplaca austrocitrina]
MEVPANFPPNWGKTALIFAVEKGNEDCLLTLLRNGANANAQDVYRITGLHIASHQGNLASIKVLLAYGANMEVPDRGDRTALILAVANGDTDCVLALLRNGADANAQNKFGLSALQVASLTGSLSISHELCKHHAIIGIRSTPIFTLKYHRSSQYLLQFHDRLFYDRVDREVQTTALRAWSLKHLWELWYLLLIRKKLLDIRVWKEGGTALDFAALGQHDEIVRLLEYSAQPATRSDSLTFEEYLFDLLGVSSAKEAEEELKRRIEEEREKNIRERQDRRFKIAQRRRRLEEIERYEDEEKLKEDGRSEEEQLEGEKRHKLEVLERTTRKRQRLLDKETSIDISESFEKNRDQMWGAAVKKQLRIRAVEEE